MFGDVLVKKQACLDNRNMDFKKRQPWHFFKGDSPWVGQKVIFFSLSFLSKRDREKVFVDVLDRKEASNDKKNRVLWKTQNLNFSKGVGPSFSSKISDFFNFVFYAK